MLCVAMKPSPVAASSWPRAPNIEFHPNGTGQALIRRGKTDLWAGRVAYLSRTTVDGSKYGWAPGGEGAVFRRLIGRAQVAAPSIPVASR